MTAIHHLYVVSINYIDRNRDPRLNNYVVEHIRPTSRGKLV